MSHSVSELVPGFDRPYFLAGLAGYSDGPMRLVSRRYGCPFCVTESLRADILLRGGKGLRRQHPDRWLAAFREAPTDERRLRENCAAGLEDHPLAAQVIGCDPDEVAAAVEILVSLPFEVIDVNLACPSKKSAKRTRQGGNLLTEPELAIDILREVRRVVPEGMPTSVKLRRAYDDTSAMAAAFETIISAAFDLGYAWATVHARTVEQRYEGPSSWPFLRDLVRRHAGATIFGSGDVFTAADIFRMLEETGVAAVAVARGAIGNPWIFREAEAIARGEAPAAPTSVEMRHLLEDQAELVVSLHGEVAAAKIMRKFGILLSRLHPESERLRRAFVRASTMGEWREVLSEQLRES